MIEDKTIYQMEKQTSKGFSRIRVKGKHHKKDYEDIGYTCKEVIGQHQGE